jgi:hypothetical protein
MAGDLDLLAQISVLVRRPGFSQNFFHSTQEIELSPDIEPYIQLDELFIEKKILGWKSQGITHNESEVVVTPEILQPRSPSSGPSNEEHVLLQRLAMANTRRREQLLYWSRHPDQSVNASAGHKIDHAANRVASYAPVSTPSNGTSSIVAASGVPDMSTTVDQEGTIYAESTVGINGSIQVPDICFETLMDATFECPYCHLTLESARMQDRQEWK